MALGVACSLLTACSLVDAGCSCLMHETLNAVPASSMTSSANWNISDPHTSRIYGSIVKQTVDLWQAQ